MVRIIHWHLSIGYANADRDGTVEVEDNATDEDIEEAVKDDVHNFIEYGWHEPEEGQDHG